MRSSVWFDKLVCDVVRMDTLWWSCVWQKCLFCNVLWNVHYGNGAVLLQMYDDQVHEMELILLKKIPKKICQYIDLQVKIPFKSHKKCKLEYNLQTIHNLSGGGGGGCQFSSQIRSYMPRICITFSSIPMDSKNFIPNEDLFAVGKSGNTNLHICIMPN